VKYLAAILLGLVLLAVPRPAGAAVTLPADLGTGAVALTTVEGTGYRYVLAKVTAVGYGPKRMLIDAQWKCGPDDRNRATTNVSATMSAVLYVRLITDAPSCTLYARSATINPTAGDGVTLDYVTMQSPAGVHAVGTDQRAYPTLLYHGTAKDVHPTVLNAGGLGYLRVFGDVKLTSCHQVGGSRENGSPYLCTEDLLSYPDHLVTARLVVSQYAVGGGYCQSVVVDETLIRITAHAHHVTTFMAADYPVSSNPACTRQVRAKLWLYGNGGNNVVHAGGTIVGLWR
jgi:hypothetical protein